VRRGEWLERTADVAALWGFAVVAPLLHLLGGHPEFFATRGTRSGDIVALALAIALIRRHWQDVHAGRQRKRAVLPADP